MLDTLFLVGGLALILLGANGLTDGAAAVAKRFNISDLVIGLTIVAFGTSAPELVISTMAALGGSADMAIGNVVGSNIFNVLAIIGVTAMVMPIKVGEGTLSKEIPLVVLASMVLAFCANDILLDGGSANVISRIDGLVLLGFFLIFLRYTFAIARNGGEEAEGEKIKEMPIWKSTLFILGGLAGLIYGGQLFVDGASGIASSLGVSESIIGLTIVAGGTSLPELATCVVAALKGKNQLALGNVIGSNIFNIALILGASAVISPFEIQTISVVDTAMVMVSILLLWMAAFTFKKGMLDRVEGALFLLVYVGYITYLTING